MQDSDDKEDKEQDADARDVLDKSCSLRQLWEIGRANLGIAKRSGRIEGANTKPKTIDAILEKLRDEASGLHAVWKSNSTRCCPRGRV